MEIDDKFLKDQSELLEGFFPGLSERLDELDYHQYGRGIVIRRSERNSGSKDKLIGYILPVKVDEDKHVVIFKDGNVFIVQPKYPEAENHVNIYRNDLAPSESKLTLSDRFTLVLAKREFIEGNYISGFSKIVLRSDDPEQVVQVQEVVKQAMEYAKELRAKRLAAKESVARQIIRQIDELLGRKPTSEDQFPQLPQSM